MDNFITKEQSEDKLIVRLQGALDGMTAPYLSFDQLMNGENSSYLILDCKQVSFLDSAGVSAIVKLFKECNKNNMKMSISAINGQPESVAKTLQLGDAIDMIDAV